MSLAQDLREIIRGEVSDDPATLSKFSRDASLLNVTPTVVVAPKDVSDIEKLVRFVAEHKKDNPELSITPRSAGTDMSGGPLNDSIILDMLPHFAGVKNVDQIHQEATVLPGTFYRDFEKDTLARGLILPCYTASREINTVGGMVGNNSAGEKTLRYGQTKNFVVELKVVFSDGKERVVKPLNKGELEEKIAQGDFEGKIYEALYALCTKHSALIQSARPRVSKNSAGYFLWDLWDPSTPLGAGGTFDLTKLICGSQGTLGIVTEIRFKLVPQKKVSKLLVIFMPNLAPLADLVNTILPFKPESLESYDDNTARLAIRFFPDLLRVMKTSFLSLAWSFLPELGLILRGGLPKLVLLAEVAGDTDAEVEEKLLAMQKAVAKFNLPTRITHNSADTKKYWTIRRESFNLLRKHVHGKRTAPFIDDIIVEPKFLPHFLPQLTAILDQYKIFYTIAGHAGNGNFHIIPLMDMHTKANREIIPELSAKVYDLVLSYKGSITAEHNDGIVRTPYLLKMYGGEVTLLFRQVKNIFDPQNIFNPGKKVPLLGESAPGTQKYMYDHLARE